MQCSHISHPKSTTDTQTSLKDEIENANTIDRFASERKLLLSKFKEVQDKINLQIVDLVKTVGQLKEKKKMNVVYMPGNVNTSFASILTNICIHIQNLTVQNVVKLLLQNITWNLMKEIYMKKICVYQIYSLKLHFLLKTKVRS